MSPGNMIARGSHSQQRDPWLIVIVGAYSVGAVAAFCASGLLAYALTTSALTAYRAPAAIMLPMR